MKYLTKKLPVLLTSLQLALPLTLLILLSSSFSSYAEQDKSQVTQQSYSLGHVATDANSTATEQKSDKINRRILLGDNDQLHGKALSKTRTEVIADKKQLSSKKISADLFANMAKLTSPLQNDRSFDDYSFLIYEGYSQLIEDYDEDGYFQTFSVTFDADLITYSPYDEAVVYAELYLSENGGPWIHYYTTDSFIIQGESSDDVFEVYSTLEQGFSSNHYDVLIDLYEEGYTDIVATYSSDDSNSLYALPLESRDYDEEYVEYYSESYVYGGSYSLISLAFILLQLVTRRFTLSNNKCK